MIGSRLSESGFSLSPSQPKTKGDGACMPRSLADQINQFYHQENHIYGKKDHKLVRQIVCASLPNQIKSRQLSWPFVEDNPKGSSYISEMSKVGVYGDHVFLKVFANIHDKDIVIIPLFKDDAHIQAAGYSLIKGGQGDDHGKTCPIFLAYFSEAKFAQNSHYQSIIPISDSSILYHLRTGGGFDVAGMMGWAKMDGQVISEEDTNLDVTSMEMAEDSEYSVDITEFR